LYYYSNQEPNESNYKEIFANLFKVSGSDDEILSILSSQNLVKNSNGNYNFDNWERYHETTDSKWIIEEWGTY
jgi:hypothetical protein